MQSVLQTQHFRYASQYAVRCPCSDFMDMLSIGALQIVILLLLLLLLLLRKLIYKLGYDHQSVGQWTANCRAEGQHCSAVSTLRPL